MKLTPDNTNAAGLEGLSGPRYWRSLDQLADTPEFKDWLHREFPAGASEVDGVNRRRFLQIMTASFALAGAGMAGCRRPETQIRPYAKQPERVIPGVPVFYATSLPMSRENIPLVVETHQSRPTKIEGNPKYEPFGGATNLIAQASVLDLYDPDRATRHYRGTRQIQDVAVNDLIGSIGQDYVQTGGQGLAILAEPSTSPTRARLVQQLRQRFPRMLWAEYEPVDQSAPDLAARELFGSAARPIYFYNRAKRILSIDSDFVHREPGHLGNARGFTATRKVLAPEDAHQMSRLYVAESVYTLTGVMADHRLRIPTSHAPAFAALVLAEILEQTGADAQFAAVMRSQAQGVEGVEWARECARDLIEHRGEALVVAGSHLPVEVQVIAFYINELLGSIGRTMQFVQMPEIQQAANIRQLADAISQGTIDSLFILGGNPGYNAPADINWNELAGSVATVVRHGYYFDETSVAVTAGGGYHLTAPHFLESWSDGRTFDGTYVPVQPMILPLFGGITENELLARLANLEATDAYGLVRETFSTLTQEGDVEKAFNRFLFAGLLPESQYPVAEVSPRPARIKSLLSNVRFAPPQVSATALELRILPDNRIFDGRYNNNGWLQECPDPVSKLTWDNAIWISPVLAREIGYEPANQRLRAISATKTGEFRRGVEIAVVGVLEVNGQQIRGPIQIQPGLADYTVAATLGYGRQKTGRVGTGTGFNVYPAVTAASPSVALNVRLEIQEGESYRLANTQEHWSLEGRAIIREGTSDNFSEDPEFAQHMGMEAHSPPVYGAKADKSLQYKVTQQPRGNSSFEIPAFSEPYPNVPVWNTEEGKAKFKGPQQWGMTIDMNSCIGCSSCVVACQSENNIPIVGKDQVIRGREMHWLRIDRYYASGDVKTNTTEIPSDPQVSFQPMACVHCERAPCEQVCPVNATVHDKQGLNVMAYNRCVGTRYCSNNCPYKVRRFNFFNWNKREIGHFYEGPLGPDKHDDARLNELKKMQVNPDVTVRMRGVMEKCTYCVQRIQSTRIAQLVKTGQNPETTNPDDTYVPDGLIKTACQQSCPTDAIEFGDVSDPDSVVSRLKNGPRDYTVLGYLNTRPRTSYLARLRNPNPRMPDYYKMPLSYKEYQKDNGAGHGESHQEAGAAH